MELVENQTNGADAIGTIIMMHDTWTQQQIIKLMKNNNIE